MEKYTMFMDRKNQCSENEYTTQSNLQIQCNPYQATSHIFHRTRTNKFKICMEIQKTSNSQSNLEKEEWNYSDFQMLNKLCIPGINSTWSRYIIIFIHSCIQFINILLQILYLFFWELFVCSFLSWMPFVVLV